MIALSKDALQLDALSRILAGHSIEVGDERIFAIGDVRVVLPVLCARKAVNGLLRPALIEHQVIEGHDVRLVAFQ
jgi:hypothetical protein